MSLLSAVLLEANKATTDQLKKHRDELLPKIKDLIERVQMLSWALKQNFVDTYVHFTVTKSLEQLNYKNRKANIVSDYTKNIEGIKLFREQHENDEEFISCCEELSKSYDTFKDICIAVEGKIILERANHDFGRFNYSDAMLAVKGLKKQIQNLKLEGNMVAALSKLNAQAENQLALYTAHLSIEWEDIFKWSEKKGLYYLTYSLSVQQSDPILLKKVLQTMYVTERINAELGLFSHFFINQLLHNIVRHNCDIFTEDHMGAIVFNIKIDLNDTQQPTYQTIFNNLTAVFEFLHSTLGSQFESDCSFIEVFAETIQKKFFNKLIEDCIRNNLPSCGSSYENYKNIVVELDSFNRFLIELKFVKETESPLNKYIDDTECVLYNKKCDKLLSDIRCLLTESLSYGTLEVGCTPANDDSVLNDTAKDTAWDLNKPIFLPKCVISQNVKKIMMLIVEHLEESAKLPEKYSQQLVGYIKDVAIMYQCIVPKKFKVNLECCPSDIGLNKLKVKQQAVDWDMAWNFPLLLVLQQEICKTGTTDIAQKISKLKCQMAALFFNNCFYLAHGLLGPPWCNTLPRALANQLVLVLLECIQDLRVLGLEKMSLYLQKQKNIIIQSIEFNDQSTWTHDTYEQFDCAINSTFTLMKDLQSCWHNILPGRMYEMSLCTLVQALCQSILDRMFCNTKAISEELVYIIAMRVEDIVASIVTLFEEPMKFEAKINVWTKLTKLPQLLKAQLLEISVLWNKKDQFQSYTCEEVRQIIKMRFPDDKYRLRILKEIQ